jgi:hypothetical protein
MGTHIIKDILTGLQVVNDLLAGVLHKGEEANVPEEGLEDSGSHVGPMSFCCFVNIKLLKVPCLLREAKCNDLVRKNIVIHVPNFAKCQQGQDVVLLGSIL